VFIAGLCVASVVTVGPARGQVITSNAADFEPRSRSNTVSYDSSGSIATTSLRVGYQTNFWNNPGNSTGGITTAFLFQLPAAGAPFTAASLKATVVADSGTFTPTFNADVYVLGFTNSSPPTNTATDSQNYFFTGPLDAGAGFGGPGVTRQLIKDNFLVPADYVASGGTATDHTTDAVAGALLLSYVNDLYANQATNGFIPGTSSLIVRINQDNDAATNAITTGTQRYQLGSGDAAAASQPTLTLTPSAVPEPGSFALAGLAVAGLAAGRRRKPD
jgi:MYXO-CTERM domain-containing protein